MNKATTTNIFYLKKTTSSECDNNKQFGISKEVIREFFDVPEQGNTHVLFIGSISQKEFDAEIQTATDPRLGNAGIREFLKDEGGIETGDYILFTKLANRRFSVAIIKKDSEEYKCYSKLFISDNDKHAALFTELGKDNLPLNKNSSTSSHNPRQTIYYGVPGSGKSHKIDEVTKNLPEEQVLRVVFHPEYTNADFVGQILPSLNDGGVDYRFKAGPFSRILKKAIQNPNIPYYLIIEEINRGNAAAIFGDLFQLLDRSSDGYSCYEIENLDLNAFIRSKSSTHTDTNVASSVEVSGNIWTENTGIRLPPNLSILATMNTSDQNVFTLDNAFQRRWDMELVENVYIHENSSPEDKQNAETQRKSTITVKTKDETKTITWGNFQAKINEVIAEKGNESGFSSMEDKRLGCWFIKNQDGVIDTDKFANKVLKYLWDDAFKFNRNEIFIDEIKNFEELKKSFMAEKGFGIFKDMNFSFETEQIEDKHESQNE